MLKCDPRAYAECPTRQYCGASAADCDFMEGSECDQFNQQVLSRPIITHMDVSFFDKQEIHPNCTVQVLTNTVTGDVSVGWWNNEEA